jgi:hypothetical protein
MDMAVWGREEPIRDAQCLELSGFRFKRIVRIGKENKGEFYLKKLTEGNWNVFGLWE